MKSNKLKYAFYGLAAVAAVVALTATAFVKAYADDAEDNAPGLHENTERVRCDYMRPEMQQMADSSANVICDSLGTLRPVMERLYALRCGADSVVSILHVGDSHVQGGFWTARVREHLHRDFGNAGRGLIVPYKLAGSNEPANYAVASELPLTAVRTNPKSEKSPSPTSISFMFDGADADMRIWSKNGFNALTVLHHPNAPMLAPPDELALGTYCSIDNTPTSTRVLLTRQVDTLRLTGRVEAGFETPEYYGFSLENGKPGVLYHAIGYNGAAFQHMEANTTIMEGGLSVLMPELIVVSLGTNNCYGGNYNSGPTEKAVRGYVERLQTAYPSAVLLLTTPWESAKSLRRPKETNPNIEDVVRIIKMVAREKGIAYWDMYEAMGGKGAAEKWFDQGLMNKDRIHLSAAGYTLTGDMMYEALAGCYNGWLEQTHPSESELDVPDNKVPDPATPAGGWSDSIPEDTHEALHGAARATEYGQPLATDAAKGRENRPVQQSHAGGKELLAGGNDRRRAVPEPRGAAEARDRKETNQQEDTIA